MNSTKYPKAISNNYKSSLNMINDYPKKKNTEKQLNSVEKNFSKHLDKFLKGYSQKPVKRYETLNNAMKNALKSNTTGGITMSKKLKKYTLRKGNKLFDSPSGEITWLKSNGYESNSSNTKSNRPKLNNVKSSSIKKKNKKGPKYVNACYKKCQVKCNSKYGNPTKSISPKSMSIKSMSQKSMSPKSMSQKSMSQKSMSQKSMSPKSMSQKSTKSMSQKSMSPKSTKSMSQKSTKSMSPKSMSPKSMSQKSMSAKSPKSFKSNSSPDEESDDEEIEVEPVTINGVEFFLDSSNGNIYDKDTHEIIGKSENGDYILFDN